MMLKEYLIKKIKRDGPITMADYMHECLYNPQFGYYQTRNPIGAAGDFITAPEVSQLFGELIGIWLLDLWQRSDQTAPLNLVEFGPGQGTMMADILRTLADKVQVQVHLVEVNQTLIKVQKQKLPYPNVQWHKTIPQAVASITQGTTIFLANEFFDALPIHQLVKSDIGWQERYITIDAEDNLKFSDGELSRKIYPPPIDLSEVRNGAIYEYNPVSLEVTELVSKFLEQQLGAFLIIDYGTIENLLGDTLQAIRHHSYNNILEDPGNADLTAHINFFKLVEQAKNFDVNIFGPNLQGTFLSELGINIRAKELKNNASEMQIAEIDRAVHRLTSTIQMGNMFKVLCLTSKNLPKPSGFATCSINQHLAM